MSTKGGRWSKKAKNIVCEQPLCRSHLASSWEAMLLFQKEGLFIETTTSLAIKIPNNFDYSQPKLDVVT